MKLTARRYCSAQFVTRFMYKLNIAGVAIAILATICCGTNASAEDVSGRVLSPQRIRSITSAIDGEAIIANANTTKDWLSYGLDYSEGRYSKLSQINTESVKNLGLKWTYNLESLRGVEATPLVVDGIMYVSASWCVVHAIDVPTGKRVWEKDTIIDHSHSYTVTGAPRVVKGKVLIGNGGAEYGARGYITAYDAETGAQAWRWFVVPGDPSKPYEDESMEAAAKTWDPAGKYWINGGGGTPWDTMAYDPDLNLVYIGTGNGAPWTRNLRSPSGGDNLYLASIVALNPDTGKYVWHYQETPGDNWDYTSTQQMILANITLNGQARKVILHAPKNGFFFVIDRTNGQFISAKNYVDVNWATGYDASGRPIEVPEARGDKSFDSIPGPYGAHNWHPMSFNPQTGFVYIPAQNVPMNLTAQKNWTHNASVPGNPMSGLGWNLGYDVNLTPPKSQPFGRLIAWDPVKQEQAWKQDYASPWNGGTLTTAGNLVFQGTADGRFVAYNAKTGEKLWGSSTGTGVVAGPATYVVDGTQYVSVAVGWGGVYGESERATGKEGPGTVFTFAIGGKAPLPEFAKYQIGSLLEGVKYDAANVGPGTQLYVSHCGFCHGVPGVNRGGNIRNLGYSDSATIANLKDIVFKGPFMSLGMPDFTGRLSEDDVVKIQAFIQGTADAIRAKK